MGYAAIIEVDGFLGQALTSGAPEIDGQVRLINVDDIGTTRDLNRIPNEIVELYISAADSNIDGVLTQQYVTPLKKCVNGQWTIDVDIGEYNNEVILSDATNLVAGDEVVFRNENTGYEENHIVGEVIDQKTFRTQSDILEVFDTNTTRVFRLSFPPPVNQISARLAAANIYDKYFSAQNAPNVSEYGNELRKVARGQLNDILNGRIILKCQTRIGDRFASAYLDDNYSLRDRGFDSNGRNMSSGE